MAFFFENNAMSQMLVWCRENLVGRYGIPKFGDDEEFPLTPGEINMLRKYFRVSQSYPTMLFFELVSWYFLKGRMKGAFRFLDRLAFRTPLNSDVVIRSRNTRMKSRLRSIRLRWYLSRCRTDWAGVRAL